jgi:hypothetical protein
MIATIYMEQTLNLMNSQDNDPQQIQLLIESGEVKTINDINYLKVK